MTPPVDSKPAATATPAQPRTQTLEAALKMATLLPEVKEAAVAELAEMKLKMAQMELALAASQAEIQALRVQYKIA